MELIVMALGAICQIHARQQGQAEPTFKDELAFVLRCTQGAIANKQANYADIDDAVDAFKKDTQSLEKQRNVIKTIQIALVVHVFYDDSVDASYTDAIRCWLTTLGIE